ncbi:MAG: sulfatase [Acidobacteria bacterium]|nr:sulfatase [Acidobacteriota bacterium]
MTLTRRQAGAPLLAAFGLTRCAKPAPKRPNILFVIADDQSWPVDRTLAATPAFDRLASQGTVFDHAFSACPSCTASRSAVLTGRPIWQTREAGVLYGSFPTDLETFPNQLAAAGYHTGFTGKGWAPGNWQALGRTKHPIGREYNSHRFPEPVPAGIDPRNPAANFAHFLADRPAGAPFCFWFGSTEPHRVYKQGIGLGSGRKLEHVTMPPYWPDVPQIRGDILDYYYEVEWFDRQLGRVIAHLEQTGELDNTLVVATSDNGTPFPRAKVNLYDPGVRMPLVMRWPGHVPAGRRVGQFVSHTDFAPTFLQAAGLPVAGLPGRSLLASAPGRDHAVTALERHTMCRPEGATYPVRALRTAEYLYIRNFQPNRWPTGGEFISSNFTRHGDVDAGPVKTYMESDACQRNHARQYQLCYGRRPAEELYHLATDPHQVVNVSTNTQHAEALKSHAARLEQILRASGDPRMEGKDPWQNYIYHQTTGYGASFNLSLPEEARAKARALGAHKPE